ncbi:MAG TPA: hypothetical protein VMN39_04325, partial [Longimicrobiaceae bacterium]|nr:hypothetical protein [Longimicrobiaceae bacterium]
ASPMALIVREAGGRATDGERDILSIQPTGLHEKTPLYLGSHQCMDLVDQFLGPVEERVSVATSDERLAPSA